MFKKNVFLSENIQCAQFNYAKYLFFYNITQDIKLNNCL